MLETMIYHFKNMYQKTNYSEEHFLGIMIYLLFRGLILFQANERFQKTDFGNLILVTNRDLLLCIKIGENEKKQTTYHQIVTALVCLMIHKCRLVCFRLQKHGDVIQCRSVLDTNPKDYLGL